MSHFYASIQGNRGEATRGGSKASGIRGHIRGWDVGVSVTGRHSGGADIFEVRATGGSNGFEGDTPVATVVLEGDRIRVYHHRESTAILNDGVEELPEEEGAPAVEELPEEEGAPPVKSTVVGVTVIRAPRTPQPDNGTHVILNRGPALKPVTWDDATPERAAQRAEALASLHNAEIERRPDGSWIVDATEYYWWGG